MHVLGEVIQLFECGFTHALHPLQQIIFMFLLKSDTVMSARFSAHSSISGETSTLTEVAMIPPNMFPRELEPRTSNLADNELGCDYLLH